MRGLPGKAVAWGVVAGIMTVAGGLCARAEEAAKVDPAKKEDLKVQDLTGVFVCGCEAARQEGAAEPEGHKECVSDRVPLFFFSVPLAAGEEPKKYLVLGMRTRSGIGKFPRAAEVLQRRREVDVFIRAEVHERSGFPPAVVIREVKFPREIDDKTQSQPPGTMMKPASGLADSEDRTGLDKGSGVATIREFRQKLR